VNVSSGTGLPGLSQIKGCKTVVVVVVVYLETIQAKTDGQSQRSETELTGYRMNVLYEC